MSASATHGGHNNGLRYQKSCQQLSAIVTLRGSRPRAAGFWRRSITPVKFLGRIASQR